MIHRYITTPAEHKIKYNFVDPLKGDIMTRNHCVLYIHLRGQIDSICECFNLSNFTHIDDTFY